MAGIITQCTPMWLFSALKTQARLNSEPDKAKSIRRPHRNQDWERAGAAVRYGGHVGTAQR